MKKLVISTLIFLLFNQILIRADRRYFARSYTSYTLPANALELEIWNTGKIGKDAGSYYRWLPRVEFEYGVTDKFTTAVYFNFDETRSKNNSHQSKSFSFVATSVEMRYRLFEIGEYFIDPALYSEIYFGGDKIKYEPKIFLTKRFQNLIGVMNINSEIEWNVPEHKKESKFELTGGLAFEMNANFSAGFEIRYHSNFSNFYEEKENQAFFAGPTLSIQTEKFYFTLNLLAQVSGIPKVSESLELVGHEKYEVRTILGIEL